jgi:hypothetical protein
MLDMDLFDKRILAALRDGKPRDFQQLLREVGFSHNTLRLHLASLERRASLLRLRSPWRDVEDPASSTRYLQKSDIEWL